MQHMSRLLRSRFFLLYPPCFQVFYNIFILAYSVLDCNRKQASNVVLSTHALCTPHQKQVPQFACREVPTYP